MCCETGNLAKPAGCCSVAAVNEREKKARSWPAWAEQRLRLAVRVAWLTILMVPNLTLHFVWRALGRPSPWPRRFLRAGARACGVRVRRSGRALTRDVFFVANHLSWVDILVLGGAEETIFVAQDKIEDWPLIGWMATLNDTVFVSRTDRAGVAGQIALVREAIAQRRPVTLFPEGTTTDGCSLLPFKPSLFASLDPPPRPLMIQPVVLEFDAAGRDLAWIGTEGAAENAFRVFGRRGTFDVTIHYLEPFDPAPLDRKGIAAEARRRIACGLARVHGVPVA